MKKYRCLLLSSLLFYCFLSNVFSQNGTFPILAMDIQTTAIANDTSGGLPDLTDSTIFNAKMNISLFDTTGIDKIDIMLGDVGTPGGRLQHTFDWDVSGTSGNGTSYSRNRFKVTLDLSDFMGLLNFEASVRIKKTDGTYTDQVNFSR